MDKNKQAFYLGTSNIILPVANKGQFPEEFKNASRLTYYASIFNSLEINSSFYKIPMQKTVARWEAEVPEGFRISFKLNRDITHDKTLVINPPLIEHFMRTINTTQKKKGSLLIQFPAGIQCNPRHLKRLLSLLQKDNEGWDLCIEFRHNSWYCKSIYRLLESFQAALVIHDKPLSATPPEHLWTDFTYLRFHGPKGDYRGVYELHVLEEFAEKIKVWLQAGKTVYAYFNNSMGNAVFDALTLHELVTGDISYNT